MKRNTESALKLRPVTGLLEAVEVHLPVSWAASLRVQAGKLDMPLEDLITQYCGHLPDQCEKQHTAVASPTLSDDPA